MNAQENIKGRKIETKFSEGWDTTPALGITKGEYYSEELKFGRGEQHLGILEVVINSEKIVMVEFNEIGRPDYHTVAYQNQLKRNSEYNFMMGEIGGSTWIQGVLLAEKQVLEKQNLITKLDYVAGATETVVQGFEPLAKIVNDKIKKGTNQKFYRVSKYESILYKEDSKVGFRYQMNKLNERVVETQDLFDLNGSVSRRWQNVEGI